MRDLDEALYTIANGSEIARLHPGTSASWFSKDWIKPSREDRPAKSRGATTMLSGRRVLQLAIAAEAVALGVHPKMACAAARHFTDLGDDVRVPGELFSEAGDPLTALVIYRNGTSAIVPAGGKKGVRLNDVFFPSDPVAAGKQSRYEAASVLMLDFIVKRVVREMEAGEG